ncbi:lipase family protein [Arthrobacter pigmenti]
MTGRLDDVFPDHSWSLDTQPGGYTVLGGKGGISFSWQELLRGARELEALAAELRTVSRELDQAADGLKRLRSVFSLSGSVWRVAGAAAAAAAAAGRQTSEFADMAEKVRTAYSRYADNEHLVARSFELTTRPGRDAMGNRTALPQVSEGDSFRHWEDEAAGYLAGLFVTGPMSTTLLQPAGRDRSVENFDGSLSGLLQRTGELDTVNGESMEGAIEVAAITVDDQPERYVVIFPGIETWDINDTANPHDLAGSLAAISQSPYMADAVTEALKEAGAPAGADVMLVGHSGGGLHARSVAANADFLAEFDPRYVVTAGSPAGNIPLPDQTVGLNLQQKWDPVPGLDLRGAPDTVNNVTVEFQDPAIVDPSSDAALAGHELHNYVNKAEGLEMSEHASVAPVVAGMAAFAPKGASVSSYKFKLARKYDRTARSAASVDHPDYRWPKGR